MFYGVAAAPSAPLAARIRLYCFSCEAMGLVLIMAFIGARSNLEGLFMINVWLFPLL